MKIKLIWIAIQALLITFTVFNTLFIPAMYLNFKFVTIILNENIILEGIIIFILISLGLFFISLAISGKVMYFFNDLYKWDEQWNYIKRYGRN